MYIFRDPTDAFCPIVLHFPLVNTSFRDFKAPGVKRETESEKEFADFNLFQGEEEKHYSTFRFQYHEKAFDRLAGLAGGSNF